MFNLTGLLYILSWKEHLSNRSRSLFGQGCLLANAVDLICLVMAECPVGIAPLWL